jgi:hypothetical protein
MLSNTTAKRVYWLIFKKGDHWYCSALKRGYGHVYVVTNNGKQWMQLDPLNNHLSLYIYDCSIDANLPHILANRGFKVIKVVLNELDTKRSILRPFLLLTCVEIVKYIVGLRLWCWTPYGLYKKLIKFMKKPYKGLGIDSVSIVY